MSECPVLAIISCGSFSQLVTDCIKVMGRLIWANTAHDQQAHRNMLEREKERERVTSPFSQPWHTRRVLVGVISQVENGRQP